MFRRTELLIGKDNLKKLNDTKVILFGVGGVGGYVAEMLVRSGIGEITLVDYDVVDISNKNRQIIALDSTIGKNKVDVLQSRLHEINPNCQINALNKKLLPENIGEFELIKYDYIIDAIDMVTSKIALIEYAHINGINIISAMGAGNRYDVPEFFVTDIYCTSNDGLAKILRNKLRKLNISSHNVVCTKSMPTHKGDTIGSIAYYPAMCGCVLSAFVINSIINKGE